MQVLIIGAGLGGLTLATALSQRTPDADVAILERDPSPAIRRQGYSITLRKKEGLGVMEALGLLPRLKEIGTPVDGFEFRTAAGRHLLTLAAPSPDDPEHTLAVERAALRTMLLQSLPPSIVEWDTPVAHSWTAGSAGRLRLADGSIREADLIVAADGARSSTREELLSVTLRPLGLSRIEGMGEAIPGLDRRLFFTIGAGCSLFFQPSSTRSSLWSFTTRRALDDLSPPQQKDMVVQATQSWHAPIPQLVTSASVDTLRSRFAFATPPPSLCFKGRVALLGDASHPMPPYRGSGGNMAMLDALTLADALSQSRSIGIDRALEVYQRRMLPRNRKAVRASLRAARSLHTTSAPLAILRNLTFRATDQLLRLRR